MVCEDSNGTFEARSHIESVCLIAMFLSELYTQPPKKDPAEGYKDGRSNRKVTAVDGTIEASLGTAVRHGVRWGA